MVLRVRSCIVTNPIFYKIQIICRGNQNRLSLKRFQEIKNPSFPLSENQPFSFRYHLSAPPQLKA